MDNTPARHSPHHTALTIEKELQLQLAEAQQNHLQQTAYIRHIEAQHEEQLQQLELERDQIILSLMESEERYRTHISATTAVIWHGNGVGEFCVPQQSWQDYTGQAWPDHEGTNWLEMLPDAERMGFMARWQRHIRAGDMFTMDCQVWSAKDDAYRFCEISAVPMYDVSQNYIHTWVGSLVDVHVRKLTEQEMLNTNDLLKQTVAELKRSNTELDRFVYIASHDLKEPLRGMQNLSTMLKDLYAQQLDEEGLELLTMIYESGNRMQQLIADLHNYSRVQLLSDRVQDVEPDRVLDGIIVELQALYGSTPFGIVRPHKLPTLRCNPMHLQTIFKNLLSNALRYHQSRNAEIEVGVLISSPAEPTDTVFYVRDNGIGIAPDNHTIIFEMFKRLHAETEYGGGTGAGLALVKKILEQYGGEIWVESAPSQGSTFYFTFGRWQDTA